MPWMVTAIVVRELLIQGLRSHLEGRGQAVRGRMAGKLKTVVQCLSIRPGLVLSRLVPSQPPVFWWLRDGAHLARRRSSRFYSGLSYVWIALPKFRGET